MKLRKDNYRCHNYHNEKVIDWLVNNFTPSTDMADWGGDTGNNWGCDCETVELFHDVEGSTVKHSSGHFVAEEGEDRKDKIETPYVAYHDVLDAEDLAETVPNLTDEEKQDLIEVVNIRVYACDVCKIWSVDGDNL